MRESRIGAPLKDGEQVLVIRSPYLRVLMIAFALVTAQQAWANLPISNQPILVVQDSGSAEPFQNFIPEMLTTEGINGFQVGRLGDLTSETLSKFDLVVLPHLKLN